MYVAKEAPVKLTVNLGELPLIDPWGRSKLASVALSALVRVSAQGVIVRSRSSAYHRVQTATFPPNVSTRTIPTTMTASNIEVVMFCAHEVRMECDSLHWCV
jgi:hypothetical protein